MINLEKKILLFIAHANILHKIASFFVLVIPQFLIHNLEKYQIIKNIFYTLDIDDIKGDYLEFGCFTGSSLKHAISSHKKFFKKDSIMFYGFDSFEGFPENVHKTFTNENFKTDYNKIKKISFAFIDCDLAISAKPVFKFILPKLSNGAFIMIDDYYNIDKKGNSILKEFSKYKKNKQFHFYKTFGTSGKVYRFYN